MNRAKATNDPSLKNILVGFSGGPSSRAMLQLLSHYTSNHNKYGRLKICYIDETLASDDHTSCLDQIQSVAKLYSMELVVRSIAEPMGSKAAFTSAFAEISTPSAQEDFMASLRHSLLIQTARTTKLKKICIRTEV